MDGVAYRLNAGPDNNPPTMGHTSDGTVGQRLTYRDLIVKPQETDVPPQT